MKICQNCNLQFASGKFCKSCGQPLSEMVETGESSDTEILMPESSTYPAQSEYQTQPEYQTADGAAYGYGTDAELTSNYTSPEYQTPSEYQTQPEYQTADGAAYGYGTGAETAADYASPEYQMQSGYQTQPEYQATDGAVYGYGTGAETAADYSARSEYQEQLAYQAQAVAPVKPKKKRWGLRIAMTFLVLVLVILGGTAYYLGFTAVKADYGQKSEAKVYWLQSLEEGLAGDKVDMFLSYGDINEEIKEKIEIAEIAGYGFKAEEIYYHPAMRKLIVTLSNPVGKTSLLADPMISVSKSKIRIWLENIKLGKWGLPVPERFLPSEQITWNLEVPKNDLISVKEILFTDKGLNIKGEWNKEFLEEELLAIQQNLTVGKLKYLEQEKGIRLPAYQEVLDYQAGDNLQDVMKALIKSYEQLPTWFYVLDPARQEKYLSELKIFLPEAKFKELMQEQKAAASQAKNLEKEYQTYLEDEIKNNLIKAGLQIFQAMEDYHRQKGVPFYILNSRGKAYSQTLQEYMDLQQFFKDETGVYELYAESGNPIVGAEFNGRFWYVTAAAPEQVEVEDKAEFLRAINYQEGEDSPATLLARGNYDRTEIAEQIGYYLHCEDSIFIEYLAMADNYAFLVASPDYAPQVTYQFLLKKEYGYWEVKDEIDPYQKSLRQYLLYYYPREELNVRIFPPFEIADFVKDYLGAVHFDAIRSNLFYSTEFGSKFQEVAAAPVNYYSRVGGNVFVTYNADHKYLFVGSKIYNIPSNEAMKNYFSLLQPHPEYPNYYPTFIFYQD
ncbi:hypothetical protein EII17_00540 [Clostridiales bacterium COT073_COT-073]|nr:hypothetical protein EII17_00540 [Clostridiales bacterium COT073_COT-073]